MRKLVLTTFIALLIVCATTASRALGQNTFGQPSTIIHISLIQWKEGAAAADRKKALDGVKEMAGKIPGIKNVWIRAVRMQPEGYHDAFVIEFEDKAAADRYATHPVHDTWTQFFQSVVESSISPQITNE